jgi:NADPH-dependent 2,4-dienoyl-CoA reductase/sulfur reductase-like enzyme
VTLTDGNESWVEPCDYLACGFYLVPNLELPRLVGCDVEQGRVQVDNAQQTSLKSVYAAGEITGIGGVSLALLEGRIAGHNAAGQTQLARPLLGAKRRAARYANRLDEAFKLRPELRQLSTPDTIVCRCEDVPHAALTDRTSMRDAKLQTRCGMGTCQARICAPVLEFLFGWTDASVRPPLHPVSVRDLMDLTSEEK